MMENCIITPTFSGHFPCIDTYLRSVEKYVTDKEDIPIVFTIEAADKEPFDEIIEPYRDHMNLQVLYIDDLLQEHGIYLTPKNALKKYGKYTYQTFKKFYTMEQVDAERFLVLDSESSWIRETNMQERFEQFFEHPRIYCSVMDDSYKMTNFKEPAYRNICYILGTNDRRWYLEQFMWYYEKRILMDLLDEYGPLLEIADRIRENANQEMGIFEILLYCMYVGKNAKKYGYKIYDLTEICQKRIPRGILENYIFQKDSALNKEGGLLEHVMLFLDEQNVRSFAGLFHDLEIDILRCDCGEASDVQKKFIGIVQPHILAASQNHEFGVNPLSMGQQEKEEESQSIEQEIQALSEQIKNCHWREMALMRCSNRRHVFWGTQGTLAEKLRLKLHHMMRPGDIFVDDLDGGNGLMLFGLPVLKTTAVEQLADQSIILVLDHYDAVRARLIQSGYIENIDFIDGRRFAEENQNLPISSLNAISPSSSGMIIYGLGEHLHDMLTWHPWLANSISRIIDKDTSKIGTRAVGVLVESPDVLHSMPAGTEIAISAIRYFDEIKKEIHALNPRLSCRNIDDIYQNYSNHQSMNSIEKTQASVPIMYR